MQKKPYNQGFSVSLLLEGFYAFTSKATHSAARTYRIISSVSLLILRVLYPRAPSRPSVSPCRMGGTPASTYGARKYLYYRTKFLFFTQLDNNFSSVQFW